MRDVSWLILLYSSSSSSVVWLDVPLAVDAVVVVIIVEVVVFVVVVVLVGDVASLLFVGCAEF